MIVGIIGAGTMGSGIAQAFAMTDGYEVRLCDIKEEFAENGKAKVLKNLNFLVSKEKITQEKADEISGKIKTGLKDIEFIDYDFENPEILDFLDYKINGVDTLRKHSKFVIVEINDKDPREMIK